MVVYVPAQASAHSLEQTWLFNNKYLIQDCKGNMTRLVHLSGDKGMQWHEVVVYVPSQTSAHSFVLQAVKGDGVLSDIAVDDLEYYVGKCKCE